MKLGTDFMGFQYEAGHAVLWLGPLDVHLIVPTVYRVIGFSLCVQSTNEPDRSTPLMEVFRDL